MKTTDDKTYYDRHNYSVKINSVKDYISRLNDVNSIIDFGCNNGEVSKNLTTDNVSVLGIDYSSNLNIPKDYNFINANIVEHRGDISNDCAIFLSLYHHILGKYGLETADDLFYRIFFNTKYLIFDCGNVSEKKRDNTYWLQKQKKYFKSEKELLDHFGLTYEIISKYEVGGGVRSIVVFKNDDNINYGEKMEYQRMCGSEHSNKGLFKKGDNEKLFKNTTYHKLKLGDKYFFTKKHKNESWNNKELMNTILLNEKYDKNLLIKFYGYNEKYGLVFEWLDDFKYSKKIEINTDYITLKDVDEIKVDNKIKHIDFHW